MLPLKDIRSRLRAANISHVSRATGLSYNTVRNVRDGIQANPTMRVMEALSRHLQIQEPLE